MPKIELSAIPQVNRTGYPAPFDQEVAGRWSRRLRPATGLSVLGAAHTVLKPGAWSSQRHWHRLADEIVVMLEGEAVLVEDGGETVLRAGDCAAFPKNSGNGHHLINRSQMTATYLEVGSRSRADIITCSDIDMMSPSSDGRFLHKDGRPYE